MAKINKSKTNGTKDDYTKIGNMVTFALNKIQYNQLHEEYLKNNSNMLFCFYVIEHIDIHVIEKENTELFDYVTTNPTLQEKEKYSWVGISLASCLTDSQFSRMSTLFKKNGGVKTCNWWKFVLLHCKITVSCLDTKKKVWCENLTQEDWEEKYDGMKEMAYLHGFCHDYALKIGTKDDKYIVWTRWDDDLERTCLLHCFILTKDKDFKDIRGITNNKDDIYKGFEDWDITSEFVYSNKEEFKKGLQTLGLPI